MQGADSNLTPTGRVRKPTIEEVSNWVIQPWKDVKKEVIVKSFKKCGISNDLNGNEDDEVYVESGPESDNEAIEVAVKFNEIKLSETESDSDVEFIEHYDE